MKDLVSAPYKPVGPAHSKEQSEVLSQEQSFTMVEDSGQGYACRTES